MKITFIDRFIVERRMGLIYTTLLLLPFFTYNTQNMCSAIYTCVSMMNLLLNGKVYVNPMFMIGAQLYGYYGTLT